MGKVSRLLTLDLRTRRLRLPREYLELVGLGPGTRLHMVVTGPLTRCILTASQWSFLNATSALLGWAFDEARITSAPLTLDKQGRVVLSAAVAFRSETPRIRLRYHIDQGVLVLAAVGTGVLEGEVNRGDAGKEPPPRSRGTQQARYEQGAHPDVPSQTRGDVLGENAGEADRPDGLFPPGPVRRVRLGDIKGVDPTCPVEDIDAVLADSIAEEGMRDPVVLHGSRPYRVIDGWKRIRVAVYLEMDTVPAVVFSRLDRRDVQALRYLLDTRRDPWTLATLIRRLAALRRDGASLEDLARLVRRRPRTVQRYLRIASRPELVQAIASGRLSLREAEKRLGTR